MFGTIGTPELLIIFVVALVVFGPRRLPELGRSLGSAIAEFKRATRQLSNTLQQEIEAEERPTGTPGPAPDGGRLDDPRP